MTTVRSFLSLRNNYDAAIAGLAGWLLILAFTHHSGIGISPDSINYVSAARNLAQGNGLMTYDSMPFVDFPVGYPIFLRSAAFVTAHDAVAIGPWLNGFLFAVLIFLSGCVMQRETATGEKAARGEAFFYNSRLYKRLLLAIVATSASLLGIYTMLWSETLFTLEGLALLLLLRRYLQRYSGRTLLLAAVCAGVACVTRYAGVAYIGVGLVVVFWDFSRTWKQKWGAMALYFLVSIAFLAGNLLYNRLASETLTGSREASTTSLWQNMLYYGQVLCGWVQWHQPAGNASAWTGGIVFLALTGLFLWRVRRPGVYKSYTNIATAFFLVYVGFIVLSASVTRYEPISNRLLMPAFVACVWALSGWLPGRVRFATGPAGVWLVVLPLLLLFGFQLGESWKLYNSVRNAGIPGYTDDSWERSPFVERLKQQPMLFRPGYYVYSNAPEAVYFFTGASAMSLPHTNDADDLEDYKSKDSTYLVWFRAVRDTDLVTLPYVREEKALSILLETGDGVVYWTTKK